jgi:hypothetical protein
MDEGIERVADPERARASRRQARGVLLKSLAATALLMVAVMLLP